MNTQPKTILRCDVCWSGYFEGDTCHFCSARTQAPIRTAPRHELVNSDLLEPLKYDFILNPTLTLGKQLKKRMRFLNNLSTAVRLASIAMAYSREQDRLSATPTRTIHKYGLTRIRQFYEILDDEQARLS